MSLWGRIAGACLLLVVFLVSCRDDLSTLGFRNPLSKFKVAYKEIDIPTSVMLTDSLPTFNSPNFTKTQRFLVGGYTDDQFGRISATTFTQIRPLNPNFVLPDDASLIGGELFLTVDYYYYGSAVTPATFSIHALTDSLSDYNDDGSLGRQFFYNTSPAYESKSLGSVNIGVNPSVYDELRTDNEEYLITKDTLKRHIETHRITIDKFFASDLFLLARGNTDDFKLFRRFKRIFKGLAFVPNPSSEVIVGINPDFDKAALGETKLVLNYTTFDATEQALVDKQVEFGLFKYLPVAGATPAYQIGFSKIDADRSSTALSGFTEKYGDVALANDMRYVQAGNPVVTKLDFGKFFEFTDTISTMSLNAAELVISGVESTSFLPPEQLSLRILKDNNRFDNSSSISFSYAGYVSYDNESKLVFSGDNSEQFVLNRSENDGKYQYSGFLTSYLQLLYNIKTDSIRYHNYGIVPFEPEFQKSVNRLVFNKDNIKLRLYYTRPNKTNQ